MTRLFLSHNYTRNSGTIIDDMSSTSGWGENPRGTHTIESVTGPNGDTINATKLTVNAAETTNQIAKSTTVDASATGMLGIDVYFPTRHTNIAGLILAGLGGSYANNFTISYGSGKYQSGWVFIGSYLDADSSFCAVTGSPDISAMNPIRLRVDKAAGAEEYVYFSNLRHYPRTRPKIIFSFDDGNDSDKTEAYDYMYTNYGFLGTSFIISTSVEGLLGLTNMATMYANGWDFGNHTNQTDQLTNLSSAARIAAVQECTNYLNDLGYTRASRMLAYPGGTRDGDVVGDVVSAGIIVGRTADSNAGDFVQGPLSTHHLLEMPTYNIGSITPGDISPVTTKIDQCIKIGATLNLYGHEIVASGATGGQINRADFRGIVDYVYKKYTQGLADVVTFSQWYQGLSNPRAAASGRVAA